MFTSKIESKIELLKSQIEKTEKEGKVIKAYWLYGKLVWVTLQLVSLDMISEFKNDTKNG